MPVLVSASELAFVLKLTPQRVNQLAQSGVFRKDENGKLDIAESAEIFYRRKFHADEKRATDYDIEHAMLERAKRQKAELELSDYQSQLLDAHEVEQLAQGIIQVAKARFLSIPEAVAPKVVGEQNVAVIVGKLQDAVYEALEELHEMPAEKIMEAGETEC